MIRNPVEQEIERDRAERRAANEVGPVAHIARKYDASYEGEMGRRLLGFLPSLNYDELSIVICESAVQDIRKALPVGHVVLSGSWRIRDG